MTVWSCGYRFSGGEGLLGGTVRSVSVQVFKNQSRWSDLDVIITNDIITALRQSRSVNLVTASSGHLLCGTIEKVQVDTLNRSSDGAPQEKYVEITISTYLANKNGKKIWQSRPITEIEAYFPAQDHQDTLYAQKLAMKQASQRLAQWVISELGQGF